MKRGEIWWASLGPPAGSQPGFRRPVVIVQSNAFNDSLISTVLVAVVTSNLKLADAPGNVRVRRADSQLPRTSVVNISQLLTLDRRFLAQRIRPLPASVMSRVDEGIRLVLGV